METLKFILFAEAIVIFILACVHGVYSFIGKEFELLNYAFMAGLILVICLFIVFVVDPVAEWWFNL